MADLSGATVWCVFYASNYDGEVLERVFSSEEHADAWVNAQKFPQRFNVGAWEIDAAVHRVSDGGKP